MMAFALVAQPLYGFVSSEAASAVPMDSVTLVDRTTDSVTVNFKVNSEQAYFEARADAASGPLGNGYDGFYWTQGDNETITFSNIKGYIEIRQTLMTETDWQKFEVLSVDNTAPTASITSHNNGDIVKGIVNIVGMASTDTNDIKNTYFAISDGTQDKKSDGAAIHNHEWDTTGLDDGAYTVLFKTSDKLGNKDEVSIQLIVDNTAPTTPVLSVNGSSASTLYTNQYNMTANWAAPVSGAVRYEYMYWNDISTSDYNASNPWVNPTSSTGHFGTFDQGQGSHYIKVRAYDSVGNSSESNTIKVVYDMTAPTVESFTYNDGKPGENATVRGVTTFNVKLNESNPSKMYVEYMEKDTAGVWRKIIGKEVKNSDLAQLTVNTAEYKDGEHQIKVSNIVDKAGNAGATKIYKFNVDNTPPEVNFTSPSNSELFGKDAVVNVQGIIGDGVEYQLFINGELKDNNTGAFTNNGFSWIANGVTSGNYSITVIAYDAAGNDKSETIFVNIDADAPKVAITGISPNSNGTYTITGTTDDNNSSVMVVTTSSSGNVSIPRNVMPLNGKWSVTTPVLAAGEYRVFASSQDVAGNKSVESTDTTDRIIVASSSTNAGSNTNNVLDLGSLPSISPVSAGTLAVNSGAATQNSGLANVITTPTEDDGEVLGMQDSNKSTDKVAAITPSEEGWKIFGFAWYWWLLILAAIAGIWWAIAGYRRRNNEEV